MAVSQHSSIQRTLAIIILNVSLSLLVVGYLFTTSNNQSLSILDGIAFSLSILFFQSLTRIIQRYYHSKELLNLANTGTLIFFSIVAIAIQALIVLPYSTENYQSLFIDTLPIRFLIVSFIVLITLVLFWSESKHKNDLRIQQLAIQKERELIRIELNGIQQQFKPHFLFNSLNSINALMMTDTKEAQRMIQLLSDFMRQTVRSNQNEQVPLEQELEYIRQYTDIERVRFGHRLEINYSIEESSLPVLVPAFILQPLIENAIKYGLYGSLDKVTISIETAIHNTNELHISIRNPFNEESQRSSSGTGFGLSSIKKKLYLTYQRTDLLKTINQDNCFIVELTIPLS